MPIDEAKEVSSVQLRQTLALLVDVATRFEIRRKELVEHLIEKMRDGHSAGSGCETGRVSGQSGAESSIKDRGSGCGGGTEEGMAFEVVDEFIRTPMSEL